MKNIALITGSSRGIGAATAKLLAQNNYAICINYVNNGETAHQLADQLSAHNSKIIVEQADVSQEKDVLRLFYNIDKKLGTLTALVNNVGIVLPQMRLEDMQAERINQILTTNITSQFLCCREAVKRMSTAHGGIGGAIVNVSSAASRTGSPGEYIDYAASKGAIDTLTKGLSLEVANQGIRVNGVRPGFIHTDIHGDNGEPDRIERLKSAIPMQRGGTPEEVAQAITWLLSAQSSYATGSFIDIAGGR